MSNCVEKLLEKSVPKMTDQQLLITLHRIEQLEVEFVVGPTQFRIVHKELAKRRCQKDRQQDR